MQALNDKFTNQLPLSLSLRTPLSLSLSHTLSLHDIQHIPFQYTGIDVIQVADRQVLSSAAIVGIAVGGVLLLLFIVDLLCCITVHMGVMAAMCRKAKRSPSEIDDEAKLGSGQLVKEPPPSPLPLPPPVKLGGSPLQSPLDEKEPLRTPTGSIKQNSTIEFDGRFVHSRSGEIIGKNSAV